MATSWVKSLHCKSTAPDDVFDPKASLLKKPSLSSCAATSSSLRDVVLLFPKHPPRKPRDRPKSKPKPKSKSKPKPKPSTQTPTQTAAPPLAELPAGHSSRRVVEIIFASSWPRRGPPFQIEILFRVHNPARTVARFEEYRAAVRSRTGGDARCAADGNEMMRFHCRPSGGDDVYDGGVAGSVVAGKEGKMVEAIRTFAGSGGAHEVGGDGTGRRAMLVCRVIAGRVRSGTESEGESVSVGPGELLVFDPRAVLPCFLIIYKV